MLHLQEGRAIIFLSIKGKEVMGLENENVPFTLDSVACPVNSIKGTNANWQSYYSYTLKRIYEIHIFSK